MLIELVCRAYWSISESVYWIFGGQVREDEREISLALDVFGLLQHSAAASRQRLAADRMLTALMLDWSQQLMYSSRMARSLMDDDSACQPRGQLQTEMDPMLSRVTLNLMIRWTRCYDGPQLCYLPYSF